MRFLPRSLFGRLVIVLLAGVGVAQLVTLYINASERDQLLYRSGGMQVAQRIADLASLLDSMTPAERRKIAAVFDEFYAALHAGKGLTAPMLEKLNQTNELVAPRIAQWQRKLGEDARRRRAIKAEAKGVAPAD